MKERNREGHRDRHAKRATEMGIHMLAERWGGIGGEEEAWIEMDRHLVSAMSEYLRAQDVLPNSVMS